MVEEMFEYASLVRGALNRLSSSAPMATIRSHGDTEEARARSWVMAQYLVYMGCSDVRVLEASRHDHPDPGKKFVWVDAEGVSVDINARRLPKSETLVIISEVSVFHSTFEKPAQTKVTRSALKARPVYVEAYETLLRKNPALKHPRGVPGQAS